MIDTVENLTTEAEEVTEQLTHSIGVIITKTTPLLAPLASGLTVLFAFYDGGGKMLADKVTYPHVASAIVGFIIMIAVEGINFAAIHNRDRADEVKRMNPNALTHIDANSIVNLCLWLTFGIVFALESLPGAVSWWYGQIPVGDMVFRFGLLILPFFSRAGAKIYSLSAILDAFEGVQEGRKQRKIQQKREAAKLDLEIEIERARAKLKLDQDKAEHAQKLELQRIKAESGVKKVAPPMQLLESSAAPTPMQPEKVAYDEEKLRELVRLLMSQGDTSNDDLAVHFGVHKTTIGRWVKFLADAHVIEKKGHSKILNGRHQEFLAGASL